MIHNNLSLKIKYKDKDGNLKSERVVGPDMESCIQTFLIVMKLDILDLKTIYISKHRENVKWIIDTPAFVNMELGIDFFDSESKAKKALKSWIDLQKIKGYYMLHDNEPISIEELEKMCLIKTTVI